MITRVERFPVRVAGDAVEEVRIRRRTAGGRSWTGLFAALAIGAALGYLAASSLPY